MFYKNIFIGKLISSTHFWFSCVCVFNNFFTHWPTSLTNWGVSMSFLISSLISSFFLRLATFVFTVKSTHLFSITSFAPLSFFFNSNSTTWFLSSPSASSSSPLISYLFSIWYSLIKPPTITLSTTSLALISFKKKQTRPYHSP